MTVGHAPVPDAQEVEDRCGQRVFVGLRQQAAIVATTATAADEVQWSTMGTTGDRAFAPPSAPSPSAASRVGSV